MTEETAETVRARQRAERDAFMRYGDDEESEADLRAWIEDCQHANEVRLQKWFAARAASGNGG